MDGLSLVMAAQARAVSAKGRGSRGWPRNKGPSVAGRAEAGGGRGRGQEGQIPQGLVNVGRSLDFHASLMGSPGWLETGSTKT